MGGLNLPNPFSGYATASLYGEEFSANEKRQL